MPSPADRLPAAVPPAPTATLFDELPAAGRRSRRLRVEEALATYRLQRPAGPGHTVATVCPDPMAPTEAHDAGVAPAPAKRRERRWPGDAHPWLGSDADDQDDALPAPQPLAPGFDVVAEPCQSLLRANDSPDLPYALAINPYRGCAHGCLGCELAQPETPTTDEAGRPRWRIHAKSGAADRLREALRRPGYVPRPLNLGSATDAYQPLEREVRLTRALLEVLVEARHPVALATRSAGVVRDADLLAELAAHGQVLVLVGLATLDPQRARLLEPRASPPAARLQAIRTLAQAGVPVGLNLVAAQEVADADALDALLAAGAQAGARSVHVRGWRAALEAGLPPGAGAPPWWPALPERAAAHGLGLQLPTLAVQPFRPPSAPLRPDTTGPRQRTLF